MKTSFKIYSLFLVGALSTLSCNDDGESFTPSASDLQITIDENPINGQSLGTVATNINGTLVYSISDQNPNGAFAINSVTGEISVADASKFNFEINPILEATISVTNSEQTANSVTSVSLNDIDDVWYFLSDSREAYMNAAPNDWIKITENEYNAIAENIIDITKCGTSDSEYNSNTTYTNGSGNYTWLNDNDKTIPSNSYLFAFKLNSWANNGSSTNVKLSSSDASGPYITVGTNLPEYNSGDNYFVLKSSIEATQNETHLGIFGSVSLGAKVLSGSVYRYSFGNAEILTEVADGFIILFQGLSTTVKQWD